MERRSFLKLAGAASAAALLGDARSADNSAIAAHRFENKNLQAKFELLEKLYILSKQLTAEKNPKSILNTSQQILELLQNKGYLFVQKDLKEWYVEKPSMLPVSFIFELATKNIGLANKIKVFTDYFEEMNEFQNVDIVALIVNQLFEKVNSFPIDLRGSEVFSQLSIFLSQLLSFLERTYSNWNQPSAEAIGLRLLIYATDRGIDLPNTGTPFRERIKDIPASNNIIFR